MNRFVGSFSGASSCRRTPEGEPAVITMRGACRWSINLFRRVFPAQYARRCPDSRPVSRGVLRGYRFAFRGYVLTILEGCRDWGLTPDNKACPP